MTRRAITTAHAIPLACPYCAAPLRFSTGADCLPAEGDFTICAHCIEVASFAPCGLVRVASAEVPDYLRAELLRLRAAAPKLRSLRDVERLIVKRGKA